MAGALEVAGAVLAGVPAEVCGTAGTVDVVGMVSPTVVGGTVMEEQAAATSSVPSQIGRILHRWRATAVPLRNPASDKRTRFKDLLREMCSLFTAAGRPAAHNIGCPSREDGTLPRWRHWSPAAPDTSGATR